MNKSNELIKKAVDSGDYVVDENGKVFKKLKNGLHEVAIGYHKSSGRMRLRIYGVKLFLHRVVGYSKFGDRLFENEIHHIDENALNNHPSNLGLASRGYHLKVLHAGENNKAAKLTWPQVNNIRKLYNRGFTNKAALARMFGVSDYTIMEIVKNLRWKNEP